MLRRFGISCLLATTLVAGCSASSDSHNTAMQARIQTILDTAGASLTPSQREALEDLEVTFDEYERAYFLAVECMRAQGLYVDGPNSENNGRYLTYSFGGQDFDADAECRREYLGYIDPLWIDSQLPTGNEAEQIRDRYKECVIGVGLNPPDDVDLGSLDKFVAQSTMDARWGSNPALLSCIRQYSIAIFASDP
jgi:hypothetical protein